MRRRDGEEDRVAGGRRRAEQEALSSSSAWRQDRWSRCGVRAISTNADEDWNLKLRSMDSVS